MMTENQKHNLEYMVMGIAIGVMVGYLMGLVMANTIWL